MKALKNPIFLALTLVGNVALVCCAIGFYLGEWGVNPAVRGFPDAIWWAFVTMTTVGYGDIVPVTGSGRLASIVLMLTGGVLFLSFIALLSSAFTELEFLELKREIRDLKQLLEELKKAPDRHD